MERYIGKMLDNRYEILEIIGKGGMAVVFKAKCHRLNRLVAIKVLKPELADDAEFRRRFHDESQAVAMLSHPNIVSVYDVSKGGDLEYIVMELIDGITLKQYMERRGQLNWRESLHFITQIMKGLSHAHSRGIIHRDIKPHNIMVLRDGSVKVADFGIACLSSKQTMSSKETMGSVHYISPEQAKGEWTDARSDIYSAGVVLYEMLTNRLPFEGDSPVSIAIQHFSAVPLNPREIKSDIPEALEQICMKAMAPQVKQRYASAEEMIHDLEEFRKNPEINFDYDLLDLRSSVTDEPTQPIDARELHNLREKEDDYDDRGGGGVWKKLLMTVAAIALSVALIYGLYQVILNSFAPPPVTEFEVPNLIGMTVEAAEADPRVKDIFTIVVEDTINNDEYPAGQIIHQDPEPERKKKSDFVITVLVSKGVQSDKMPSIVGLERTSAEIILKNLRLDLQVVIGEEVFSDEYPAGQVIKSVPAKDEIISKGDTVTLTISKGKDLKPVTVISFLTMTREKAEQEAVQTLGLKVKIVSAPGSEPAGTVIGQNIVAGTSVLQETEIELTVSDGSLAEEPPIEDGDFEGGDVDTPSTDPDGDD
ncbi:MAG: Stk1 family PASTA domain-containing Ser/Thr kinase [Oscillospiraceae bacterium]|jgi:serine/threonine protein kinase|nr:Stk1 family PASTA domain-containing Ser/Thr kinase [Oscillospiraceae bacterium]MCI9587473.1 Stk1 family PASTA domain-containing Ser/Thr kinase [Oscillospiraceae bacterium]